MMNVLNRRLATCFVKYSATYSPACLAFSRLNSTSSSAKDVFLFEVNNKDKLAVLKFNKPPVNSLNLEALVTLNAQLSEIEKSKEIKGVILSSNVSNLFSSGIDIMELYKPNEERLRAFWHNLQEFWLKLYGSDKVYIASINGHALALGCLIAMACDYRIMVNSDRTKIGLTAVHLGILPPSWIRDTMRNTIGHRESEKAMQIGKIYTPQQALAISLVDELVEPENLMNKSIEQMKIWTKIPTLARELTKRSMREATLNRFHEKRKEDLEEFVESTKTPRLQSSIDAFLKSLKNKKS